MPLGDFLVAYLQKIGVTHLFGIPGDLVLRLFFALRRAARAARSSRCSHEPGVGFAADGYARATGRIGVVCVTYGAGGHNMVNPVAGSFSERVPLLVHQRRAGRGGAQARARSSTTRRRRSSRSSASTSELTCAARVLDDPRTAAETDRRGRAHDLARAAARLPRDPPRHGRARDRRCRATILEWDGALAVRALRRAQGREAVRETRGALQRRAPAAHRSSASRPIATSCSARSRARRADGRAVRDHACSPRAPSRWTTRCTWACTSGRSARRRSAGASTAPTWCSTSARCSPT